MAMALGDQGRGSRRHRSGYGNDRQRHQGSPAPNSTNGLLDGLPAGPRMPKSGLRYHCPESAQKDAADLVAHSDILGDVRRPRLAAFGRLVCFLVASHTVLPHSRRGAPPCACPHG